jgi:predicted nuclease of predicted toxin-antitoxin system
MRFLANENFPGAAVTALQAAGHDVVWVRIAAPGTTDPDVLAWAARDERMLLTLDKDFGELARGSALPRTCGPAAHADVEASRRRRCPPGYTAGLFLAVYRLVRQH